MKTPIVADGPERFEGTSAQAELRRQLREAIDARHAAAWARACFFKRLWLRWRKGREFARQWRGIAPSPKSLWYGSREL